MGQRSNSNTNNNSVVIRYIFLPTFNAFASSLYLPTPFIRGTNDTFHRTELLKDEFLTVPVRHITTVLKQQKTLYKAYGVIEQQVRNYGQIARTYSKINKSRIKRGIELQLIERGSQIPKELHAAKKKSEVEAGKWDVVTMIFQEINRLRTLYLRTAKAVWSPSSAPY